MTNNTTDLRRWFLFVLACVGWSGCLPSCQFAEPFIGVITVQGVDAKKVKAGIFQKTHPLVDVATGVPSSSLETVSLDILAEEQGRVTFESPFNGTVVNDISVPMLQEATEDFGPTKFQLPPGKTAMELAVVVWHDTNGNGRLDLSKTGSSEFARTIFKEDAFLTYYTRGADGTYSATALTPTVVNRIVTQGDTGGWQSLITGDTDVTVP